MGDLLYLEIFGKAFVPKKLRPDLRQFLFKAGINEVPYKGFGALFWITLVFTYIAYFTFIFTPVSKMGSIAVLLITFGSWFIIQTTFSFLIIMTVYLYLNVKIYNRTKQIEETLPEFLTLVSTNLKGGLSFEKALWASIRPDFGILAKEVTLASKKVLTGNDIKDALEELSMKYNSPNLRRSLNLIIGELDSGGKISDVIDKVVINLKKTDALKQEMAAATVTYTTFMIAIVIFITPALFALSQQLLQIIISVTGQLSSVSGSNIIPLKIGAPSIDPKDFKTFSVFAIGLISSFSSMIISIISQGDIRGGLKLIPLFMISSITVFFILSSFLGNFFGFLG